jgi:hypothetical protein
MIFIKSGVTSGVPEYEICRITFELDDRQWVATFRVYSRDAKYRGATTLVLKSTVDVLDGEVRTLNPTEEEWVVKAATRKIEGEADFRSW